MLGEAVTDVQTAELDAVRIGKLASSILPPSVDGSLQLCFIMLSWCASELVTRWCRLCVHPYTH